MVRNVVLLIFVCSLGGCVTAFSPNTVAERESGYTYVPIDPFSVQTIPGDSCEDTKEGKAKLQGTLLQSLPDNAVRMLIERFNASGTVTYGPAKLGAKGESYRVTIDYINADTINMPVWVAKTMMEKKSGELRYVIDSCINNAIIVAVPTVQRGGQPPCVREARQRCWKHVDGKPWRS